MDGSITVTPDRLREVAPEFRMASRDTLDIISILNQVTNSVVNELYTVQLVISPEALDELWNKWRRALSNLASSLDTVAANLETAANSYQQTDQNAMPQSP